MVSFSESNTGYRAIFLHSDINECEVNRGGCAGDCENSVGSFKCTCSEGFQLAGDQLNCIGKNLNRVILFILPFIPESDTNECLQIERYLSTLCRY